MIDDDVQKLCGGSCEHHSMRQTDHDDDETANLDEISDESDLLQQSPRSTIEDSQLDLQIVTSDTFIYNAPTCFKVNFLSKSVGLGPNPPQPFPFPLPNMRVQLIST